MLIVLPLGCATIWTIWTQSGDTMKAMVPYLLVFHGTILMFDLFFLVTDVRTWFPVIGLTYRPIISVPFLLEVYYPIACGLLLTGVLAMGVLLRRRAAAVAGVLQHVPQKVLLTVEGVFGVTMELGVVLTAYFGVADRAKAEQYYRTVFPHQPQLLPSNQPAVYYVPSINPIFSYYIGLLCFLICVLVLEILFSIYAFIHALERRSRDGSRVRSKQQTRAYQCILLQFMAPASGIIYSLGVGLAATFGVDLPFEYLNPLLPITFSLNTYWVSATCIAFNAKYKQYFFQRFVPKFLRPIDESPASHPRLLTQSVAAVTRH
ncbi:unnamed protein product, partial [Mesorhabditis spiculigera]